MSKPVRVMVVDDHPVVREGLRMMLSETSDDFLLAGSATDGVMALQLVGEVLPDVVLMDLRMPGMDGLEAIERMRRDFPQVAIVILTTYNEDELMVRGLQAGASGYLLKDASLSTLLNAIRAAARGEVLVQPEILARILTRATAQPGPRVARGPLDLTEREQEVLSRVARGERSKEMAAHLGITERTIRAHLTSIFTKLGVESRTAAISVAFERGILPLP